MGGSPSFPVTPQPRERVVLVTGGNTGIGYETAKHIAMMGATVIIACRSEERASRAITRMKDEYRAAREGLKLPEGYIHEGELSVEFMNLDLGSLRSTMDFITAFKNSNRKLHVLLCNAGVAMMPRGFTEDGHETMFQVNYLSHFLIIAHLLPVMKKSGDDCRIVFTSSNAHNMRSEFVPRKIKAENPDEYDRMLYYGNSKLYQVMHMYCLSRRLKGCHVSVTSIHPGIVATEVTRSFTDSRKLMAMFSAFRITGILKTPLEGATTLIDAATNPTWKGISDVYLTNCKRSNTNSISRNQQYQEELWKYSLECLKAHLDDVTIANLECHS